MRIPWMNKGSSGIAVIDHKVGQVINLPYHHILELTTAIPKDPEKFQIRRFWLPCLQVVPTLESIDDVESIHYRGN